MRDDLHCRRRCPFVPRQFFQRRRNPLYGGSRLGWHLAHVQWSWRRRRLVRNHPLRRCDLCSRRRRRGGRKRNGWQRVFVDPILRWLKRRVFVRRYFRDLSRSRRWWRADYFWWDGLCAIFVGHQRGRRRWRPVQRVGCRRDVFQSLPWRLRVYARWQWLLQYRGWRRRRRRVQERWWWRLRGDSRRGGWRRRLVVF